MTDVKTRSRPVLAADAAALVLLRTRDKRIEVLLGRRHTKSSFLPDVYVFPGGRVDPIDSRAALQPAPPVAASLARGSRRTPHAFLQAAIRETEEETGLLYPADLASRLDYVAQAITPAFLPRRYNTRFFLGRGEDCEGVLRSNGELDDLGWRHVDSLEAIQLLDVTRAVLSEALERWQAQRIPGQHPALRITYRGEKAKLSRFRS